MTFAPDHQPYYCEENIWRLAAALGEREPGANVHVVMITNEHRRVAVFRQRAAHPPGLEFEHAGGDGPAVIWDYHVVLFVTQDGETRAWDLDSTLGAPVAAATWIDRSFRPVDPHFAPRFRVIAGPQYVAGLVSDRAHMVDEVGDWRAPPPRWTPPTGDGGRVNLFDWLDLEHPDAPGDVMGLDELRARFA
jgi:hypothetical protein